jgi:hypothetical protein
MLEDSHKLTELIELTNSMSRVLPEKLTVTQVGKKFSLFMETEGSLPCSQTPPLVPILSQMHPIHTFPHYFPNIDSNIMFPAGAVIAQWYSAGLRTGWPVVRVPAEAANFSLHHRLQTCFRTHPASYPMGTRDSFPGGKATWAWSWPFTSI